MQTLPSIQRLLDEFERLPKIGPKSAQDIVYWLLNNDRATAERLASSIVQMKDSVGFCRQCHNYAEDDLCPVCASPSRNTRILCVVSEPSDIPPIERSGAYTGLYHVLGGVISPLDGTSEADLHIDSLLRRVQEGQVDEVVLATDLNAEGNITAARIADLLRPLGVRLTRLATGMPKGGEVEFADEPTLGAALEFRLPL